MRNRVILRDIAAAITFAVIVASDLAGCSQNQPQPAEPTTTTTTVNSAPATTPQAQPQAVPAPPSNANAPGTNNVNAGPGGATGANSAVADAVNKAIHTNVQMTGSRITAVVDASGVATLAGTAQNQQQKALAVRAATNTAGVTSVKDKIEIAPTGGAKPKPVATKVIHETKVIVVPNNGANAQNSGANAGNTTSGNGTGTGATSGTTSNGSATAPSATDNGNAQTPAGGNGQ